MTADGDAPITFTESGTLPAGVTLASDGTLSGKPSSSTAGDYPITITATDSNNNTATQAFTLKVTASVPVFTSADSTSFSEGSAGTFSVTATGDTPITFTESGSLPSGVTLGTDGTLAGTPGFGTAGTYPITITATDANTNTSTQSFTLTVTASGPSFTSAASTTFAENTTGTFCRDRHRGHPDHLHQVGDPALRRDARFRRHPVGQASLRHGRHLPDHHHGDRRQHQHVHPVLHPHGDGIGTVLHLGRLGHLQRRHGRHVLGDGHR